MPDEADDRVDELRALVEAAAGDTVELAREDALELLDRAGRKPRIDLDYDNRQGYDERFLGPRLPLPTLPDELQADLVTWERGGKEQTVLPYHHFSLVLSAERRFARWTAVNIDGHREFKYERVGGDRWVYDRRIPRTAQAGDSAYGRPFDRGHLVRRLDPVWGASLSEAAYANFDTFHWTNCTPQYFTFNQTDDCWQGLEDYILENANSHDRKVTVFTGPVLDPGDPPRKGVQVPLQFWKVAVTAPTPDSLRATAYKLSQEKLVDELGELARAPADEFEFGAYKSFQVTVEEIEELTQLDFGVLRSVDAKAEEVGGLARDRGGGADELTSLTDVVL